MVFMDHLSVPGQGLRCKGSGRSPKALTIASSTSLCCRPTSGRLGHFRSATGNPRASRTWGPTPPRHVFSGSVPLATATR